MSAAAAAQGAEPDPRLVGEQPALGAVHDDRADAAGHRLTQAERLGEDAAEHPGQLPGIAHDDEQGDEK